MYAKLYNFINKLDTILPIFVLKVPLKSKPNQLTLIGKQLHSVIQHKVILNTCHCISCELIDGLISFQLLCVRVYGWFTNRSR